MKDYLFTLKKHCKDSCTDPKGYLVKENHLSEFLTEVDKAKARKNLGIPDKYTLRWGNLEGFLEDQADLYDFLTTALLYSNEEYSNITSVQEALDYLLYKPMSITNFRITNYTVENNQITSLTLEWDFNKHVLRTVSLNGNFLDTALNTLVKVPTEAPYTLEVVDTKGGRDSKTVSLPLFYFWNLDSEQYNFNINKRSTSNVITVDAIDDNYIFIASPRECVFSVGGFEGGFTKVKTIQLNVWKDVIPLTYHIYKSNNKGLGKTTITIK